jgi:NAD(P)-dependent dehydrogenase (short-subunit alcohol dehydrogenase family)
MGRTYVVTGSASGIGRAARALLERAGHSVIGVDVRDADVTLDLSDRSRRGSVLEGVRERSGGVLHGVIACAGIGGNDPSRNAREARERAQRIVGVNYFGAVAVLAGLREQLAAAGGAGAAVVTSIVKPAEPDEPLIGACLAGDESRALELVMDQRYLADKQAYAMTKRALSRWVRRTATSPEWAGAAISLNAVGPGVVDTPMGAYNVERARDNPDRPAPLRGYADPEHVASLLVWLTSAENAFVTGQVIFADGGNDAVVRGDNVW